MVVHQPTITQPALEMGREAATIVSELIENNRHNFLRENTILNSKLMVRNSTKT